MKICDLHTHSTFSDGTDTPAELIRNAARIGLSAIALTDHNTTLGIPDFLAAAEGSTVEAIAGLEISAVHAGGEMHIVGLAPDTERLAELEEFLRPYRAEKENSTRALIDALTAGGYPLDYDAVCQGIDGQPNRAHVAAAMVAAGYATSINDAFNRYLDTEHGFYREPRRPTAKETVAALHAVGARAVLAHPFYDFTEEELCRFLSEAVTWEESFDAMETHYSEYTPEQTRAAAAIAERFRLLPSGGSDYHGDRKPDIALGTGRGNLHIPYSIWEDLKA